MATLLILIGMIAAVAQGCPSSSTTASTPCPTSSTCPTSQTCAATACTSSQFCGTSSQYTICSLTTTGTGVSATVKYCLSIPGSSCTTLTGSSAATPAASYNDFASCCTATTPTAANIKYEIVPLSPTPAMGCFGTADGTKAYAGCAPAAKGVGYCVRFPNTCTTGENLATAPTLNTDFAPTGTYVFSSFALCCNAAAGASQAAKLKYATPSYYGLTVDSCIATAAAA